MIDVVFQLIIFFIVTMQAQKEENKDIILEPAPYGPELSEQDPRTMVIEIDRRGWISMHGAQLRKKNLQNLLKARARRFGEFPILIRADGRARHKDIKGVMDICTASGIWRINFLAIKEDKTP